MVLDGSQELDRYFFAIYSPDETDDPSRLDTWIKANPNWNVSINESNFRARYDYCRMSESDMVDFKTKNLDIWVSSSVRWANMSRWLEQCCQAFDEDDLAGTECYGGLDLSNVSDFTALCLDFPDSTTGAHRQLYRYWIPGDRVVDLERKLKVPLRQWVKDGYVTATPGPVIDYSVVAEDLCEIKDAYGLKLLAADPYHLNLLAQSMPPWFLDYTISFSQGWKTMSPSIKEFERAYLTGIIQSGGNPVETWMMSCATARADQTGNVKLVKPDVRRSEARIDGVYAAVMAYDTACLQADKGLEGDAGSLLQFV